MNTLVTGGSGLVGSAIESKFKPTRDELCMCSLTDICKYIDKNKIDSIIHCAAKVGGIKANTEHQGFFFTENIRTNLNVLEAALMTGVSNIVSFMSTCVFPDDCKYPLDAGQLHMGEPHPSNFGYAYAKRMLEVQGRAYRDQFGINFTTIIPCNIYGPHDNYNLESGHVIPSLIHKCYIAKENNTDFEVWGTGEAYREFIYSKDVADIATYVLKNYDSRIPLIVSPDEEISISVLAQHIAYRMGFDGNIVYNKKRDGQLRKPSDNRELKELLPDDFKFTPIEEGLQKSIDWFIENFENCRK